MISMKQLQQKTKHVGIEDNQVGGSMEGMPTNVEVLQPEKKPVGKYVDQASGASHQVINMLPDKDVWEKWLNGIRSHADVQKTTDQPQHRDRAKIPKVLEMLRDKMGSTSYYKPSVVSIGPYHYKKLDPSSKIRETEAAKKRAVNLFCNLIECDGKMRAGQLLNDFAEKIKGVWNWYEEDSTTNMGEMEFIKMMFLDGCFIIMFIRCILKFDLKMLGMTKDTAKLVQQDIVMLENQLPFQVLVELCTLGGLDKNFLPGCLENYFYYCTRGCDAHFQWIDCPFPLHLLDLLRKQWIGKSRSNLNKKWNCWFKCRKKKETIFFVPSVKELTAGPAGISLRPSIIPCLSDIHFSCFLYGSLTLPPLIFNDLTKTIFVNAIAQEVCTRNEFVFSSYVKFLDLLIDNADDVKVMQSTGILKNPEGNEEELANLISRMGAAVDCQSDTFEDVKWEMGIYIASKRRAWLNKVIKYCLRSRWTIIALLAGIFPLILTVVQTYFAVFPHRGNGN